MEYDKMSKSEQLMAVMGVNTSEVAPRSYYGWGTIAWITLAAALIPQQSNANIADIPALVSSIVDANDTDAACIYQEVRILAERTAAPGVLPVLADMARLRLLAAVRITGDVVSDVGVSLSDLGSSAGVELAGTQNDTQYRSPMFGSIKLPRACLWNSQGRGVDQRNVRIDSLAVTSALAVALGALSEQVTIYVQIRGLWLPSTDLPRELCAPKALLKNPAKQALARMVEVG